MSHTPPGDLLTADELAAVLGVHPQTVLLWAREGLIPFVASNPSPLRVRRRFRLADVQKALDKRSRAS